MDPCVRWRMEEKRRDPVNLIRSDFIRPEDLDRYREVGVTSFKIVDRACSTEALALAPSSIERLRHPLVPMFALSSTLMISKTLSIPWASVRAGAQSRGHPTAGSCYAGKP
jgi:hypothetical protein